MALVGLVRVSTKEQETARQHDALDPICVRVFEEKRSGKLNVDERPGLQAALDYMRPGDMLTVQEADRLGRNLLEGLIVLNDLFSRGIAVKVLDGIAAGEHTERSLILDLALALAEDRRRDIVRKTRDGLAAARARGRVGGRPRVVDADKRRIILARHADGESIRTIAAATKLSVGTVHTVIAAHRATDTTPTPHTDPAPPPDPVPVPVPVPEPVSGRPSQQRIAENTWGGAWTTGSVHYHDDGPIGTALRHMGPGDARMDVDSEPLANVLGQLATDVVRGRRTAQQALDDLKAVRDRLPRPSQARSCLDRAIEQMDAPNTPVPTVPDGTPEPLRNLVQALHAVPIVRREPEKELAPLLGIIEKLAAGRLGPHRAAADLRSLRNKRHESYGDAGKFEIDRAIDTAVDALRALRR